MMRLLRPRHLLAALALASAASTSIAQPVVSIEMRTAPGPRLLVDYVVPPGVDELRFLSRNPRSDTAFRAKMLRPLDDCARRTANALVRAKTGCDRWRFEVMPRRLGLGAFYEPAQPTSDGVLLHTSHYAVSADGAAVRWRFEAAQGQQVAVDGELASAVELTVPREDVASALQAADRSAAERRLWAAHFVFIGRAELRQGPGFRLLRDSPVPVWLAEATERMARIALAEFSIGFGKAPPTVITLIAAADGLDGERLAPSFHGDVSAGQTIRLHFIAPTAAPDPALQEQTFGFVAHELAHVWNASLYRSDETRPWLHEGGADWLAAVLLHTSGLVPPERLGESLQSSLTRCLFAHGTTPWSKIPPSHSRGYAYQCGMVLHALAYRAARTANPSLRPLKAAGALYRSAATLDESAFAEATQQHGTAGQALARLLRDPDLPLADALRAVLNSLGLDYREVPVAELDGLRGTVTQQLVYAVGSAACTQFVGFWTMRDYVEFDPANECAGLPPRARLAAIEGTSVTTAPVEALSRVLQKCKAGRPIDAGFEGLPSQTLPCPPNEDLHKILRGIPKSLPQLSPAALSGWVAPV